MLPSYEYNYAMYVCVCVCCMRVYVCVCARVRAYAWGCVCIIMHKIIHLYISYCIRVHTVYEISYYNPSTGQDWFIIPTLSYSSKTHVSSVGGKNYVWYIQIKGFCWLRASWGENISVCAMAVYCPFIDSCLHIKGTNSVQEYTRTDYLITKTQQWSRQRLKLDLVHDDVRGWRKFGVRELLDTTFLNPNPQKTHITLY